MKFSQVALFLVIMAANTGETNAFFRKIFGGGENKVEGRNNKNNNKNNNNQPKAPINTAADDIMNGFSNTGDES